jgi:type I restriction enzyme, S subunit
MKDIPEGWKIHPLSHFVERLDSGTSVNCEERPAQDGESGMLRLSCVTEGRFAASENKAILPSEKHRANVYARAGAILISRSNTVDLVGVSASVPRDFPTLFVPDTLWQTVFRNDIEFDAAWLCYVLSSPSIRRRLQELAAGTSGSMKKLTKPAVLGLEVLSPPVHEQRQISRVLNCCRDLLDALERMIEARSLYRRGLMQQLLTGRKRFKDFVNSKKETETNYGPFPADWPAVYIGDVAHEVSKKNSNGDELPVLSCTKHHGLVNSLEYFGKRIFSEDTSAYRVTSRGDFAYATNHIEEGSIGYQNLHDAALISPMYTVFRTKPGINHSFLFKLLKTELYRHIFEANTNGSINRRGALRWDDFSRIRIHLPSHSEQQRIAAVLEACDREIELLNKQMDMLTIQMRGLMQKLLTGKIQLKISKGARP